MLDPNALIELLNRQPPELIWLLTLLLCFSTIILLLRLFGPEALYVYIVVAIVGANIQVLKQVQFAAFDNPVALGTILFASTYLCTDILAEHYGRAAARRAVWLGFASLLFFVVLMVLTLGFAPLTEAQAGADMAWALSVQGQMRGLFTPAPALFAAGMLSYLISQYHDIWLYQLISRLTGKRHLWLRNNASTMISGLIDNTIFSVLAWVVFAPEPIGWNSLIFTFILGTYALRVVVAVLDTPFVYLARWCARPAAAYA